jgi:hypothetical protein
LKKDLEDSGMRDTELYERLLGLKEPWRVKAVKMDVEGRRVEVEVECAERTIWASPESGNLHIHGGRGGVGGIWTTVALPR